MPFGNTKGSDKTSLNEKSKLLTYRFKSEGFNLHPWRKTLGTRLCFSRLSETLRAQRGRGKGTGRMVYPIHLSPPLRVCPFEWFHK